MFTMSCMFHETTVSQFLVAGRDRYLLVSLLISAERQAVVCAMKTALEEVSALDIGLVQALWILLMSRGTAILSKALDDNSGCTAKPIC